MIVTTSDGHSIRFTRDTENSNYVFVHGDAEALDVFVDTVALAGTSEAPHGDDYRSTGVGVHPDPDRPSERILRVHEGTAAIWLQAELLNYMY